MCQLCVSASELYDNPPASIFSFCRRFVRHAMVRGKRHLPNQGPMERLPRFFALSPSQTTVHPICARCPIVWVAIRKYSKAIRGCGTAVERRPRAATRAREGHSKSPCGCSFRRIRRKFDILYLSLFVPGPLSRVRCVSSTKERRGPPLSRSDIPPLSESQVPSFSGGFAALRPRLARRV